MSNGPKRRHKWAKTAGWAAFLFFLVKGLLWLIVPALIAYCAVN